MDGVAAVTGPSGSAVIAVDAAGENTIVVAPGANAQLTVESAEARAAISDSDVLLLQLEIPVTTAVDAARVARDNGTVVIVNASPSGAQPHDLLSLAQLADVVVVNEAEARDWHWPVTHLVITRGRRGASYLGDGRTVRRARTRGPRGGHHRSGRCVRRSAGRRVADGPRASVAAGMRRGRAGHDGSGRRRLRAVCRGD